MDGVELGAAMVVAEAEALGDALGDALGWTLTGGRGTRIGRLIGADESGAASDNASKPASTIAGGSGGVGAGLFSPPEHRDAR